MTNRAETLGTYIKKILDVNKDGQITIKDFFGLFPNNAIAVAVLFVDLVVLVAEYRVWDVGMRISNDPYKALGFVLVSAIPFYLGQIFWLYPRAVGLQKIISILFLSGGLYTSAMFGLADLNQSYDVERIISWVIKLTVAYIVLALLYVLNDPGIKAWRAKVTAHAAVELEKELQSLTRSMLSEWQQTKAMEKETIDLFGGDEEAVMAQLQALRGKGNQRPVFAQTTATVSPSATQTPKNSAQWYNIDQFCKQINLTPDQARGMVKNCKDHNEAFKRLVIDRNMSDNTDISGKNFRKLYHQELDPAAQGNGHKVNP